MRVRVGVLAFLLVRSSLAFRVEALAAPARRPVVRVAHEESASRDALGVIDAGAVQILAAVPVNKDLQAMRLDDLIVLVDVSVEREAVPEAGTSAAGNVHSEVRILNGSQRLPGFGVGSLDELLDFVRRSLG